MSRTIIAGNGHKIGYVHIPCTGGRSVMHALGLLPSHATAAELRRRHPDLTHVVAIVRSPFTLLVSWYNRISQHTSASYHSEKDGRGQVIREVCCERASSSKVTRRGNG